MNFGERVPSINQDLVRCERIMALALLLAVICIFLATFKLALGLNSRTMPGQQKSE